MKRTTEIEREDIARSIRAIGGEQYGLGIEDLYDFAKSELQILLAMLKHPRWWTEDELVNLTGHKQALRRLRELRKHPGVLVHCRRGKGRFFEYKVELR